VPTLQRSESQDPYIIPSPSVIVGKPFIRTNISMYLEMGNYDYITERERERLNFSQCLSFSILTNLTDRRLGWQVYLLKRILMPVHTVASFTDKGGLGVIQKSRENKKLYMLKCSVA
jgi:hypothetical protein